MPWSSWTAPSWTTRRTNRCTTGRARTLAQGGSVELTGRTGARLGRAPRPGRAPGRPRTATAGPGRPGATTTASAPRAPPRRPGARQRAPTGQRHQRVPAQHRAPGARGAGPARAGGAAALPALPDLRRLPAGHVDDHFQRPGRPLRRTERRQSRAAARRGERRRLGGGRDRVRGGGAAGAVHHGVRALRLRGDAGADEHRTGRRADAVEAVAAARAAESGADGRQGPALDAASPDGHPPTPSSSSV